MSKVEISTTEAKQDKLFYIVANTLIINTVDATCLLLKRSENEKVFPGKYASAGGKLEHLDLEKLLQESGAQPIDGVDNILGKLAARETKEECDLDVDTDSAVIIKNKAFVRPDGVPVFMATLAVKYTGGEVVLEDGAFSGYVWATESQLDGYDCIPGVRDEARTAFALLK